MFNAFQTCPNSSLCRHQLHVCYHGNTVSRGGSKDCLIVVERKPKINLQASTTLLHVFFYYLSDMIMIFDQHGLLGVYARIGIKMGACQKNAWYRHIREVDRLI